MSMTSKQVKLVQRTLEAIVNSPDWTDTMIESLTFQLNTALMDKEVESNNLPWNTDLDDEQI